MASPSALRRMRRTLDVVSSRRNSVQRSQPLTRNLAGQPDQQPKHPRRETVESITNGRDQQNDPRDRRRAPCPAADAVLVKPCPPERLVEEVRRLVGGIGTEFREPPHQ